MLDHLLAALEREATGQGDAVRAAARAEADRITADAEARLARRRSDTLGARTAELRGEAEQALGEARRSGRKAVLQARERFLARVFDAARGMLPAALESSAYRTALPGHVADAVRAVGDEPAVIRCPAALREAVRSAVLGRTQLSVESDATHLGVTVTTADGAVIVDNTLEGRLERLRPQLAIQVLARP